MQQSRLGIGQSLQAGVSLFPKPFGARPSTKIIAGPRGFLLTGVTVTCRYMDMETAKAKRENGDDCVSHRQGRE